jgi:hypothetical protein
MREEARFPALPPPIPSETPKIRSSFLRGDEDSAASSVAPFIPAEKTRNESSFLGFLEPEVVSADQ